MVNQGQNSEIRRLAEQGLPLHDILVIDIHAHIGPWYNMYIPTPNVDSMVQMMDLLGIDSCCVAPIVSVGPDYILGRQITMDAMKKYPGRILGYAVPNPNYPDDVINEIELCCKKLGMVGIKIHPSSHRYSAAGPNYRPMWEFAAAEKIPVISHTWTENQFCSPKILGRVAKEYPQVEIILGHAGGTFKGYEEAIRVAKQHENIYLEICSIEALFELIEYFVQKIGADRVLYGSDILFNDPRSSLGRVIYAKLNDKDKQKILGLNAARMFKLNR